MIAGIGRGGFHFNTYDFETGALLYEHRGNAKLKHKDTYAINGREYQIGVDGTTLPMIDILTGRQRNLTTVGWGNHVSARMVKDNRWIIVSYDNGNVNTGGTGKNPFTLEVVAVRADGNQPDVVRRLAHHNGFRNSYANETHANPAPDGTKIVFASNWGGVLGGEANGPTSAYVILLPDWDTPSSSPTADGFPVDLPARAMLVSL